jgi:hypothetical protein
MIRKPAVWILVALAFVFTLGMSAPALSQPRPPVLVSGWSPWMNLGGQTVSAPACAASAPGKLDCDIGVVNAVIFRRALDGTSWLNWSMQGGVVLAFRARPNCVSWGANHVDCFVRREGDGVMMRRTWDGAYDSGWENLGGALASDPSCVSTGPRRLDCFARASDGRLQQISFDGNVWSAWTMVPAQILEDTGPACAAFLPPAPHPEPLKAASIECVAVFTDRTLRHLRVSAHDNLWRPTPGAGAAAVAASGPRLVCRSLLSEGRLECFVTFGQTPTTPSADLGWFVFNGAVWTQKKWGTDFGAAAQPNTGLMGYDFDCVLRTGGRTDCMEVVVRGMSQGGSGLRPLPSFFRHGRGGSWMNVGPVNPQAAASFISCASGNGEHLDCVVGGTTSLGGPTPMWAARFIQPQVPLPPR